VEIEMLPEELRGLVRHMEWADAVVWRSVLALPQAHSDTGMRECLHHVHVVQWAYLHIWRDEPIDMPDVSSFEDLRAIRAWARECYSQALEYLDSLEAEMLERQVRFPWAEQLVERFGSAKSATLAETILQITSHTTYHRGQINTRLRELGGEPPLADFIAWIWMGKPNAKWEGHPAA
jgi:uncharacterized damage-inducible protein DinB